MLHNILSNVVVYNKLYINQRSSTQAMKDALLNFGREMKLENFVPEGNMYNPSYVVAAKVINSSGKKCIAQTASIIKFFALANQTNLKLNPEQVIWAFNTLKDANTIIKRTYDTYGTMVDMYDKNGELQLNNKRTIEFIGNILGMFADAAKDPIPNALGLNEINTTVVLSMIGLGLPLEFALGFNFIGSIRKAVAEMQAASYGITDDVTTKAVYFSNVLTSKLEELGSKIENPFSIDSDGFDFDKLQIDWHKPSTELSPSDIISNNLPSTSVGYTVKYEDKDLTPEQQEYILLSMYIKQVQQSVKILPINGVTSGLMKALTPDTIQFDKKIQTIDELLMFKKDALFTKESIERLFADDKVFKTLIDIAKDLNNQLDNMFIERSPVFKSLTKAFARLYDTGQELSQRFIGFLAIRSYINTYLVKELNDPNVDEYYKKFIRIDQDNLKKSFSIYGTYDNAFIEQLNKLKKEYPDNKFLSLLYNEKTGNKIYIDDNEIDEQIIRIFATAKLKNSEYAGKVNNDLEILLKHKDMNVRLFINNLFFKELARTGMQPGTTGSFLNMFVDMLPKVSQPIDELMEILINPSADPNEVVKAMKGIYNINNTSELEQLFSDLFIQMINGINPENVNFKNKSDIQLNRIQSSLPKFTNEEVKAVAKVVFGESMPMTKDSVIVPLKNFNKETLKLNLSIKNYKEDFVELFALLGSRVNVFYNQEDNNFTFPPVIKINNKVYVISNLDGNSMALGNSMVNSFINNKEFTLSGYTAEYTVFDIPVSKSSVSNPVHFTLQELKDLKEAKTKDKTVFVNKTNNNTTETSSFTKEETDMLNSSELEKQIIVTTNLTNNNIDINCKI